MIRGPRRRRNVGHLGNVRVEWRRRRWWCRCHAGRAQLNTRRVLFTGSRAHLNRPGRFYQPTVLNQPYVSPQLSMVLGRLAHYAIDALLLSAVVAGVKRSTGFACVPFLSAITSTSPPSSHLPLLCIGQTQSSSPTQPFVRSRKHIWALEKRCSMPSKEP